MSVPPLGHNGQGWAEQSEELQARALCRTGGAEAQLPAASRLYKSGKLELETELGHEPSVWPSQSRALTTRPRTHADFWKSSSCISNFCPVLVFNNIFYFKGESKGGHCGPAHWDTCTLYECPFWFRVWLLIQFPAGSTGRAADNHVLTGKAEQSCPLLVSALPRLGCLRAFDEWTSR